MKRQREAACPAVSFTDSILESISDGVFTVDAEWRITSFNRAAEEITGIPRDEALGRFCSEVFRSSMCETDCALRRTLASGKPVIGRSCYIIDAHGRRIPISVSTAVLPVGATQPFTCTVARHGSCLVPAHWSGTPEGWVRGAVRAGCSFPQYTAITSTPARRLLTGDSCGGPPCPNS